MSCVRTVPKRKLITVGQIRQKLAQPFQADSTCPLTTGIFLRISSEAAEEDRQAGKKQITPYWRMVKDDGSLNPKFPGGVAAHAEKLRQEGHEIVPGRGKKPPRESVDFEESLTQTPPGAPMPPHVQARHSVANGMTAHPGSPRARRR